MESPAFLSMLLASGSNPEAEYAVICDPVLF